MPFDIITCGSATVDFFIHTKQDPLDVVRRREHFLCYPMGAKLLVESLTHKIGGGGTNTAVSFSKLGFRTGYIGSIGEDRYGDTVASTLKQEGITFLGMRSKRDTDCSFILDSSGHDRTILVYRNASNDLRFAKLPKAKLKAKWLYCSALVSPALETIGQVVRFAKQQHAHVAFNPSQYLIREEPEKVREILRYTDVLICNRVEAELLVGKELAVDRLLVELRKFGPQAIAITDGKHGTHATDGDRYYFAVPHAITVAEATGAGDAFASAFVAGLAKTGSMVFALELGTTNAESCIQHVGAKEGLLTWKQALQRMHEVPVQVKRSA